MSEYKTGEQMASEDPRLQETMRRAEKAVRDDLTVAYILGLAEGFRWSAERISVVGACETEEAGGEQKPCPKCKDGKIVDWSGKNPLTTRCDLCGGTGKAASEPGKCHSCNGIGILVIDHFGIPIKSQCPFCYGTGKAKE